MKKTMLHKEYSFLEGTPIFISVFYLPSYRETIKLHAFHQRKRVWMAVGYNIRTKCGHRRTRQIERFCKAAGVKCKVTPLEYEST